MAFRRGWVPTCEEGGNGNASVTASEVDEARRRGIPVRALLARESWPGSLWEDDQDARVWVRQFRQGLNQVAKFFEVGEFDAAAAEPRPGRDFRALVRGVLQDHRDWLCDQETTAAPSYRPARKPVGAEPLLPQLTPLLDGLLVPRTELTRLYQKCAGRMGNAARGSESDQLAQQLRPTPGTGAATGRRWRISLAPVRPVAGRSARRRGA